jgi:predicted metal-binding protein
MMVDQENQIMKKTLDIEQFETFLADYPVYEYRLLDTAGISSAVRVREICKNECQRYGTTWACPPAVGTLKECEDRIHSFPQAVFFSSVAEVSDLLNMEEMLSTRRDHEALTHEINQYLRSQGYETQALSTESCDICEECAYPKGLPCRFPERMHPCLESYGVVVSEIVEAEQMEYNIGGNTILWFSMILFRDAQ